MLLHRAACLILEGCTSLDGSNFGSVQSISGKQLSNALRLGRIETEALSAYFTLYRFTPTYFDDKLLVGSEEQAYLDELLRVDHEAH
jgi:hypothetical protein